MADVDDVYDAERWQEELYVIVSRRYGAMLRAMHALIGDALGLSGQEGFRLDDVSTRALLDRAAEQVVRIDTTTREAIKDVLRKGQARGANTFEIAADMDHLFREKWRGRAETVARNELLEAQYTSSMNRYQASGIVRRVEAFDGDQDALCAPRNRRVYPIAQAPTRAHVNCSLVLVPIVEASA